MSNMVSDRDRPKKNGRQVKAEIVSQDKKMTKKSPLRCNGRCTG
jgi:hypothetical protein